jgi:hypothetical protein
MYVIRVFFSSRLRDMIREGMRETGGVSIKKSSSLQVERRTETAMPIYDFSARLGAGEERHLADYRGQVLLVVNVVRTSPQSGPARLRLCNRGRFMQVPGETLSENTASRSSSSVS